MGFFFTIFLIPFYSFIDSADSCKRLKNEAEVNQPSQLKENEIGLLNSMVNIKPDPDYDQDDADRALSNDNALCGSNNGVTLSTDDIKVKIEDLDLKSETTTSQGNLNIKIMSKHR